MLPEGDINTEMFNKIGVYLEQNNFSVNKATLQGIRELVSSMYPEQFAEAREQAIAEWSRWAEAIDDLVYTEVGDYRIAINSSDTSVSNETARTPVILVMNQRSNKPSLVVDTEVLHVNEVLKLLGNPTTTFVHANGFLAVIDDTWDNVLGLIIDNSPKTFF